MPIRHGYVAEILHDGLFPPGYSYGSEGILTSDALYFLNSDPGPSIAGLSIHTFPVKMAGRIRSGYVAKGVYDDVYERFYVFPQSISVGNLAGDITRTVTLWNAYTSSKTLTVAQVNGDSGIGVAFPAGVTLPFEVPPLRSMDFTLSIGMSGPPTINATFVLNVEGIGFTVPITGRRVVLFPFAPNWSSAVDETLTIKSWAVAAIDGSEQTGSNWGDNASRTFEYQTVLKTPEEMQLAENMLFGWQGRFFALPIWTEKRRLDTAAAASSLSFDTEGFSTEPGALLVLWDGAQHNEVKEVLSVSPTGVVLTAALDETWDEGTIVYPLAIATINEQSSGSRETTGVFRMPVMFECEPSSTPDNVPVVAAPLTYRGDELYLGPINWGGAQPMSYTSDRSKLDPGTLKFVISTDSGFSRYERRHNWMFESEEDRMRFREFFGRRQGVARPVWMPSGVNDFTLAVDTVSSNNFIIVQSNSYDNLVAQHPARRDIIVHFQNGTYLCRRIIGSGVGGQGLVLTLDAANGSSFTPSDVKRISYLTSYRLSSPSVTIRHLTESKGVVDANVIARRPKGI